jgi:putative transposase
MPRANRYFMPNCVWHITHRCHKQEFLLKFVRDRKRWRYWLFQARKRYGLCVLNYIATSNHIHLLVMDRGTGEIAKSMQLIAGRTAQEYNNRKSRKGAFWEDRYHATAIDTEIYLARCMTYIDLNMVRAGVVKHPDDWPEGGYQEIQSPPVRYAVLDRTRTLNLCGFQDLDQFRDARREWVEELLQSDQQVRNVDWSESLAIGSTDFVEAIKIKLDVRGANREVIKTDMGSIIKEPSVRYTAIFGSKKGCLSGK